MYMPLFRNPTGGSTLPVPESSGGGTIDRAALGRWLDTRPREPAPASFFSTPGFHGDRRRHRRYHPHYYPVYPWYPYWYYPYTYVPTYAYSTPPWYRPESCQAPLSDDCTRLQVTARWATSCFVPRYRYLRNVYGDDAEILSSALAREEAPWCSFPARSGAAAEYERRIQLAVAVLLNAEGIPVRYPPPPPTPRPRDADSIAQPWMRALLTGWT